MSTSGNKGSRVQAIAAAAGNRAYLTFGACCCIRGDFVILTRGGSALVRRRIQTPSGATVLSVVQPEGEVVLGASPPARPCAQRSGGPVGQKSADSTPSGPPLRAAQRRGRSGRSRPIRRGPPPSRSAAAGRWGRT